MPIFLSVFFGLRAMAELPVESMRTGGALWFTDLTVPDMYWGLPILTSLTLFATLEVCTTLLCVCYIITDSVSCSVNSHHRVLRLEMTYYAMSAATIFSHSSRVCGQSSVNQNAFKTLFVCYV